MKDHEALPWEIAYEAALHESDALQRRKLVLQAQDAILERARTIEENGGTQDECDALEAAADALAKIKTN